MTAFFQPPEFISVPRACGGIVVGGLISSWWCGVCQGQRDWHCCFVPSWALFGVLLHISEDSINHLLLPTKIITGQQHTPNARLLAAPTAVQAIILAARTVLFRVVKFGGEDGPLTPHLSESLSFVDAGVAAGGVLIHCTHGTGRSAAMAIAAAMKENGKGTPAGVGDFAEAFRVVKSRRPGTDPPMPFQQELGEWASSKSA